jgi:succinate-acetate transporter protein
MAILMLIFMICATRTNVVYTLIFLSLILVFLLLTAGYWQLAEGNTRVGGRCIKVSIPPVLTMRDAKYMF